MKLFAVLVAAAVTVNYHLAATHVLGGDGGWDYLSIDPGTKHLFISRSTRVMVVDPQTATVVGEIPDTPGVHGIAIADDLGKGFTSNGRDGTVTVFDLKTLKPIATIQTGQKNPDGIAYEPVTKRVFTFNGGSNTATAIDAQTNAVVATIPLGGRPEFPAVDGRGMVYDNIESTSEIVAIDAKTATIVKRIPLGTCQHPSGLSMDQQNRRLFPACEGEMGIVDPDSGTVIMTVPTGAGTDATRFNPNTQLAFASNGRDATLTVVHEDSPDHFSVLQNAQTVAGARTMEIDTSNGFVYLVTAKMVPNPHPTGRFDRFTIVPGTFTLLTMQP
jgi:YVTN family beta-propeller protein